MAFLGLRQPSENIDGLGLEGSGCREFFICRMPSAADNTFRFAYMSVHAGVYGVAGQYGVVSEVKHTGSEHVG